MYTARCACSSALFAVASAVWALRNSVALPEEGPTRLCSSCASCKRFAAAAMVVLSSSISSFSGPKKESGFLSRLALALAAALAFAIARGLSRVVALAVVAEWVESGWVITMGFEGGGFADECPGSRVLWVCMCGARRGLDPVWSLHSVVTEVWVAASDSGALSLSPGGSGMAAKMRQ